jgi:hypothetical protein
MATLPQRSHILRSFATNVWLTSRYSASLRLLSLAAAVLARAIWNGGSATLRNTIVEGNCWSNPAVVSLGGNIESEGNTCGLRHPTDQASVPALQLSLGPLQDNAGPTMTHAFLLGSVAIDWIPEAECLDADGAPLTTDQPGEPRPEAGGTMCDVGAFEVQP